MTEREFAVWVVRQLQTAGHQALWAGGCVRDELLGLAPNDYDVATDAVPQTVCRLFKRTVTVGASFGVVEVLGPRGEGGPLKVQIATFRSDVYLEEGPEGSPLEHDGRHPPRVVFSSAREDAQRRDFTINGMFFDPVRGELIDYVGGRQDLEGKVLRAIGDPEQRFAEDKLRLLRAARMATRFDLTFDPRTAEAVRAMADQIIVVSAERIAQELRGLLTHPRRAQGMALLFELGLLQPLLPEALAMKGLPQGLPGAPTGDLWGHVMRVLELLGREASFPLALAALLHDVGKPRTVGRTPDRYTFYYHEHVGARMAEEICLRLKLSNAEREEVVWLVEKHQYLCDARRMKPSKLKTILVHPHVRDLLRLHRADAVASGKSTDHVDHCEALLREWTPEELNPLPLLTGHDLMQMGIEPGPLYKRLLDAVREAQLDGTIRTRDEAVAQAGRLARAPESET